MFIMFFPSQMNFWWNSTVCGWTPRLCRLPKGMCRRIRQGQVPGTQMTRGKLRLLASPGFRLGFLSTCSSSRFCHVFAISKTCSVLLYTYEQAICRWITLPHRALRLAPYHTFGHAVRGLEDSNISKPQLLPIQLEIKVAIHFQYARFIGRSGNIYFWWLTPHVSPCWCQNIEMAPPILGFLCFAGHIWLNIHMIPPFYCQLYMVIPRYIGRI